MDIRNPSPDLYNEDLAPAKERNWGAFSIFNVWTSDVHSLWGYYLAASLFLLCGSFLNFVARDRPRLADHLRADEPGRLRRRKDRRAVPGAGARVVRRLGRQPPAMVRAVVACFGTARRRRAASGAMVALLTRTDSSWLFHKSTHFLGHSGLEVICFVVVWACSS